MAQVVVALRQALRVVAQLVLAQQAERPGEPDLHAEIHEHVFQPARTLKAVVDQLAVAAERVAEQQHDGGAHDEQRERRGAERERAAEHRAPPAMPKNQSAFAGEKRTSPSQTSRDVAMAHAVPRQARRQADDGALHVRWPWPCGGARARATRA